MEQVACNICEHECSRLIYTVRDTNYGCPGTFSLVQCENCGLVYQNPRPMPTEMGAYYLVDQYHPFRALRDEGTIAPAPLLQQRARLLTAKISPGRVLDVGCGSGLFLSAMQQHGWRGRGVEPNESAARFARESLHLDVKAGDIFSVDSSELFDLITFWDVLEHTHTPKTVLQSAYRLLRSGGYLALNMPNWGSLERRIFRQRWIALDAPRHLYHFTPKTLITLLKTCGFTPELVKAKGQTLSLSSNVLRWIGDTFLRQGKAKALSQSPQNPDKAPGFSGRQWVIALTYHIMKLPNALANGFNQGSSIMAIARKSSA